MGFLYVALSVLDQAGNELRDPPVSVNPGLGLKACATSIQLVCVVCDTFKAHYYCIFKLKTAPSRFPLMLD